MSATTPKEKLWTISFIAACIGNFLMFFSFYLLLPILPIYLGNEFAAGKSIVGIILSSYTIAALLIRPFSGFLVDTFARKPLYILFYFLFISFFTGYLFAGTLFAFALLRAAHGFAFGMVTTSSNTIAIDIMPASRRGEGIGFFGVASNLAMASSPLASLYLYEAYGNYPLIFITAIATGVLGLLFTLFIKAPQRIPQPTKTISLDRFFLKNGTRAAFNLLLLSFSYGILSTYVAIYGKEEVGIESGVGLFFAFLASGLIISRILGGKSINNNRLKITTPLGIAALLVGFFIFTFFKIPVAFYFSSLVIGIGYGLVCPSFQALFVNLAENNQRGTANSTYLTSWDLGLGIGVLLGGNLAELFSYTAAYTTGIILILSAFFIFIQITAPHFETHKLR